MGSLRCSPTQLRAAVRSGASVSIATVSRRGTLEPAAPPRQTNRGRAQASLWQPSHHLKQVALRGDSPSCERTPEMLLDRAPFDVVDERKRRVRRIKEAVCDHVADRVRLAKKFED